MDWAPPAAHHFAFTVHPLVDTTANIPSLKERVVDVPSPNHSLLVL